MNLDDLIEEAANDGVELAGPSVHLRLYDMEVDIQGRLDENTEETREEAFKAFNKLNEDRKEMEKESQDSYNR